MKKIIALILPLTLTGCATTATVDNVGVAGNTDLVAAKMMRTMDSSDVQHLTQLLNTAKEHESTSWRNPSSGKSYDFTSLNIFLNESGQPCRTYKVKAFVGLQDIDSQQTACRHDNAKWRAS